MLAPLLRALAIQSRVIGVLLAQGYWVLGLTKHFAESTVVLIFLLTVALVALFDAKLELAEARRELRETRNVVHEEDAVFEEADADDEEDEYEENK